MAGDESALPVHGESRPSGMRRFRGTVERTEQQDIRTATAHREIHTQKQQE